MSRSLHFLVGPYGYHTVLIPVCPSNGHWTQENSTSFGQKFGLDEHNQPRKDSYIRTIASTSIPQDHTGLSKTILAFVYARLLVGQLTRKVASLPLIKVFCSRFWRIVRFGFTSTMLSGSFQTSRCLTDRIVAGSRTVKYEKRSAGSRFQAFVQEKLLPRCRPEVLSFLVFLYCTPCFSQG